MRLVSQCLWEKMFLKCFDFLLTLNKSLSNYISHLNRLQCGAREYRLVIYSRSVTMRQSQAGLANIRIHQSKNNMSGILISYEYCFYNFSSKMFSKSCQHKLVAIHLIHLILHTFNTRVKVIALIVHLK